MKAYKGIITKDEFIKELEAHRAADNFIRGAYWNDDNKGCAVGCSLESISRLKKIDISYSDHSKYPELLGISEWLARVEDIIFEGLPLERSKNWPVEFADAINVGADLDVIKGPFLICVLRRALTIFDNVQFPNVTASINTVIRLWEKGGTEKEFEAAVAAAAREAQAMQVAWAAAEVAAWAAEVWAADARVSEAARAARAAQVAVWAARAAQVAVWEVGARAAVAAAAREVAEVAVWARETYEYFADQLLELIKNVKGER